MKNDPVLYTFASLGTLGIGMILSDSIALLILFHILSLLLSIFGIVKSNDNKITKIACIILSIIAVVFLILSIISLFI